MRLVTNQSGRFPEWKGLSQQALRRKTGLSQGHLKRLEEGTAQGHDNTVRELAKALRVTVTELVERPAGREGVMADCGGLARIASLSTALALAGCLHITTQLQPEDQKIQEQAEGEDCLYMFPFPVIIGRVTVDQAKANAGYVTQQSGDREYPRREFHPAPIVRVRRVELREGFFLLVGWRCIVVVGEPTQAP